MKQEVKEKWFAALRSGKYEQTTGQLRSSKGAPKVSYCCLGVLCDLYLQEIGRSWGNGEKDSLYYCDDSASLLPESVMEWANLESDVGVFRTDEGFYTSLSCRNDDGATFTEIAKLIEKYF